MTTTMTMAPGATARPALDRASSPRPLRILAAILASLVAIASVALWIVPWQQAAVGSGSVIAFAATDRPQRVDAPIAGRVERWMVLEGQSVRAGDPIAEVRDIDPQYVERLERNRAAILDRVKAAEARVAAYEAKRAASESAGALAVQAARLEIKMAAQKLQSSRQKGAAARAARTAARQQLARARKLAAEGLTSRRDVELAELAAAKADAEVGSADADVTGAQAYETARRAKELEIEASAGAKVAEASAEQQKAAAEVAYAQSELAKIDTDLARQKERIVRAPRDGTVLELAGHGAGMVVKQGDPLAIVVPGDGDVAVELWIDGNDAALVQAGRNVRLQFEGWPALQMSGWPNVAVGTFGGVVAFVDTASRKDGAFRVVVRPDPNDSPWPQASQLRQGLRAKAWILLEIVPLGYEIWRQFNGFPRELPGSPAASRLTQGSVSGGIDGGKTSKGDGGKGGDGKGGDGKGGDGKGATP